MLVWNLWGGLIYLIAPCNTQLDEVEVIVQVAVPAPYYKSGKCIMCIGRLNRQFSVQKSNELFHLPPPGVTTADDWSQMRTAPSPWAELEFDNIILTVPSDSVRDLERPDKLAALWDDMMRGIADLAAKPHKFPRKERFVTDVQISCGKCIYVFF